MPLKTIFSLWICFFCTLIKLCFAQQPKLMLPIGHTSRINFAVFSKDGRYIVTASMDETVKLWTADEGKIVLEINDDDRIFDKYACISPDNKYILTTSDSSVKFWNRLDGKLADQLKVKHGFVNYVSYSNDGKLILIACIDGLLQIWNSDSRILLKEIKTNEYGLSLAEFSPDNNYILTISNSDLSAKIWSLATGDLYKPLIGHTRLITSAHFSNDGNNIITSSNDGKIKLWNAHTGGFLTDLFNEHKEGSRFVYAQFTPDDKNVVIYWSYPARITMIDIKGKIVKDIQPGFSTEKWAELSPDGKRIAFIHTYPYEVFIWNFIDGKNNLTLNGNATALHSITESNNRRNLLIKSGSFSYLWDAKKGKPNKIFKSLNEYTHSAILSPNDEYVLTTALLSDSTLLNIWDAIDGKLFDQMTIPKARLIESNFSSDGKYIYVATNPSKRSDNKDSDFAKLQVWSLAEHKWLTKLKIPEIEFFTCKLSRDNKYLIATFSDSRKKNLPAKIWSFPDGKLITEIVDTTASILDANLSPDGNNIITASLNSKLFGNRSGSDVKIWTLDGRLVKKFENNWIIDNANYTIRHSRTNIRIQRLVGTELKNPITLNVTNVDDVIFNTNETLIATTSSGNNSVKIWDAKNGTLLFELNGHNDYIFNVVFSKDNNFIITGSFDNTCKVWNANNGNLLYSFFTVDTTDYLVFDKENHYDGTEGARKLLYLTCGTEIIGLDQVKDQLWVPNLAERIINGDTINAKTLAELNICSLTPEIEDVSNKQYEYHFKITPRRGGLGETVLFVNGIEAKRYKPEQLHKNGTVYNLVIKKEELNNFFIAGKENPVTLKSYTADNTISSRGTILLENKTKQAAAAPNLYAVMVGVSDYKDDELDLKYAAKDATDISNAVGNAAKKLLNTDGRDHVFMYNLTTTKDRYQLPEKKSIKKILEEIGKKATANDILLIFFAGHGVMEDKKKQFYFLTADASIASTTEAIADVGISTKELTEWMKPQNIKAQKRILIFDACNSGQAIKDFVKMGNDDQNYIAARNEDKAQQIKAIDKLNEKSGLFILSASSSSQSAYEMGRYSQGLLTYALLKAIKQQPDILEDGKMLNVSRWFNAAEKTVSELSKENGARQEPQIVSNTNFNIGMVDDDVMAKIILPTEKPLFAASNFQNSDEAVADDDLELSKQINLQLNDMAVRGTESKIVYVTATNSPDAYSLSGRYTIIGNTIRVTVNIKQNKVIKSKFELSGSKEKLSELAAAIADKAASLVK